MSRPILIVEDDPDLAEGLRYNFEREQFPTRVAPGGEQALGAALDARNPPALILLDLMLPGMGGMELCRRLRREPATRKTPIIMVTARASELDVAAGLDLGADDYVTKPFSVRELIARVRAVLRRAEASASEYLARDACHVVGSPLITVCGARRAGTGAATGLRLADG
ncbi:MAG: response regulator [Pyrinomonadaceae bacterium]